MTLSGAAATIAGERDTAVGARDASERRCAAAEAEVERIKTVVARLQDHLAAASAKIVLLCPWDNGFEDAWLVSYDGPYSCTAITGRLISRLARVMCPILRFVLQNCHTIGPATMWDVAGTGLHFTVRCSRRK